MLEENVVEIEHEYGVFSTNNWRKEVAKLSCNAYSSRWQYMLTT